MPNPRMSVPMGTIETNPDCPHEVHSVNSAVDPGQTRFIECNHGPAPGSHPGHHGTRPHSPHPPDQVPPVHHDVEPPAGERPGRVGLPAFGPSPELPPLNPIRHQSLGGGRSLTPDRVCRWYSIRRKKMRVGGGVSC